MKNGEAAGKNDDFESVCQQRSCRSPAPSNILKRVGRGAGWQNGSKGRFCQCAYHFSQPPKGVVLFGTSGEGPSFSVSEKISTLKNVIAHGLDPRKIILANGSSNIPDTIELAKCARDHNCLACLIAPPSFFKNVSDEGVLAYYRAILSQVTIPVLLYHIPQFSGVAISMQTLKTLFKEFQGIVVGIKESEGNLEFTKQITKELPNCKVFVGNEMQIYEAMQHGAAGSICAKVNVYPELILSLIKEDNTKELAKSAHVFKDRNFITCCKELLAQNDPSWRRVRPPLT